MLNITRQTTACLLVLGCCCAAQATGYFHETDALETLRIAYENSNPQASTAYFRGYVAGVADGAYGKTWCAAKRLSADAAYQLVADYVQVHGTAEHANASDVVTGALGQRYPCQAAE